MTVKHRVYWKIVLLISLLFVGYVSSSSADKAPKKEETDSVNRDYSKELPRLAPKSPTEALGTFTVAEGFEIQQVACEPLVVDPVAMAFDENGLLYVIEMIDYSEQDKESLGRVRLLEDTDGDGRMDKSTVFADKLSWPTAITCYDGGVFVGAAPHIYYLKDTNGNKKADVRKIAYTGFGRGNVQGLLNTFKWGLDNRIHGATSSSGANVTRPDVEEQKPVVLRGRDFAIEPRSLEISPTSGGAQHGLSFNAWGEKFVCSNSNHIQQVLFEDRYVARNPYLAAPGPRLSIAADGPQADVFRTSPVEPWRIVRTRLRKKKIVPGPVEGGGTAAGYFTGSTGVTIFRGTAWPKKYYGWAVVGDVGSNLVHRKRLDAAGLRYIAHRVDKKSEFVSSNDTWFRPVQFANAPDGSLYILDMYREVIEHPKSLHPVIKKHLDLTSGRDRGRIYRVVGKGFKQPALPRLGSANTAALVATLDHANGWHRETAARLLYQRQDRRAVAPLEQLVKQAHHPEGRIRALYALDGLNILSTEPVLAAMTDKHPRVRQHAVRLAERIAADSPAVREKLFAMVGDDSLHVRYQLAFSLGQLINSPQRNAALAAILKHDAADGYVQLAVRSSLAEGTGTVLANLATDKSFRAAKTGQPILTALAAQIGKQQRTDDIAAVLDTLRAVPAAEKQIVQTIVRGLAAKPGSSLEKQIAAATGGRSEELIAELIATARATAANEKTKTTQRVEAVHLLRLGKYADSEKLLSSLLEPTQPAQLQAAALATLASFDTPQVAVLLVESWTSLSPSLRRQAAGVLFSRDKWLTQLLDAVEKERIALGDLQPGRLQLLASHRDEQIRSRAKVLLGKLKLGRRGEVVKAYRSTLTMKGDATRGLAHFKKICANCHKVQGIGHAIGPNLAAMRNRGPEAILLNVLDPNREVNPQYLSYAVATNDGRVLSGMIAAETATSITLRRAENKGETILRIDIDEMRSTGLSLMPEGMEKEINQQALADLIEYLKNVD